jgi:hypothetical protein
MNILKTTSEISVIQAILKNFFELKRSIMIW